MGILLNLGRELIATGPAGNHGSAARRVALSVGLPVVVLLLLGHPEWVIYAVFGSFASMYGRDEPHRWRVVHQLEAAILLVAGVTLGSLLARFHVPVEVLIVVEASFAALGSVLADAARLNPVGPFWAIFALGACASVPPSLPWWGPTALSVGSVALSLLLSLSVWRLRPHAAPASSRLHWDNPWTSPVILRQAFRYFAAIGIAGSAGLASGWGHSYWAMAASAVPLAAGALADRIRRGVHRILGTLVGIALTALILALNLPVPALVLLIPVLQYPAELFMRRHYGLAQTFFTPVVLLVTLLARPGNQDAVLTDRALETLLGAVVGMAVAVLFRERRRPEVPREVLRDGA